MWCLRIMSGNQAGQVFELKLGKNLLGRSPSCDLQIQSGGVSKEHCEIHVYQDKVMIVDLRSSNGTYVNGVKTQNGIIRLGDKVSVHDIILDVIIKQESKRPSQMDMSDRGSAVVPFSASPQRNAPPVSYQGNLAVQMPEHQPQMQSQQWAQPAAAPQSMAAAVAQPTLFEKIQNYLDTTLMPGVYKLAAYLEFRYVLLSFVLIYVFSVTMLSMVPSLQMVRANISDEAGRRAKSLAKNLAQYNQSRFSSGEMGSLSTQIVDSEDGVKSAIIVQQADGLIIAPASKAGSTVSMPKIREILKETKLSVFKPNDDIIIGVAPMGAFDPVLGEVTVKAIAIVTYDLSSKKVDDGRIISLFMQSLLMSCILGVFLFYFMYKLIEFPIVSLNNQLDIALKEKKDHTEIKYLFEPLQNLVNNINSLLTRYSQGDQGPSKISVGKDVELSLTVQAFSQPVIYLAADGRIVAGNSRFDQLSMTSIDSLIGQNFSVLPDSALVQNLDFLMNKAREMAASLHSDTLEFTRFKCQINCQALTNESGDVAYFLFTFSPIEDGV